MNQEQITARLKSTYPDASIEVFDLTGAGNHWEVNIATKAFQGLSRIQQHQAVMAVFGPELKTGEMHALSLKTKPKEI
jgi:stress-induced morphogen